VGKKSSFFTTKPRDEFRDAICKIQLRNNDVIMLKVLKLKSGNVLKPLLETIISDRNEIELQENDGFAEITLKQVHGAVIRFLTFDSRDQCIAFIFRFQLLDSSQSSGIVSPSSKTNEHKTGKYLRNDSNNEKYATATSHKTKSSLIALSYAHKSFVSDEDKESGGIQDKLIELNESRNSEATEFDDAPVTITIIRTRASEKRPSATEHKLLAVEDDEFSIEDSATARLNVLDKHPVYRPKKDLLSYSPISEEDRTTFFNSHVRDINESADARPGISSKSTDCHELPDAKSTQMKTNQFVDIAEIGHFGNVDLPEPQTLPLELLSSSSGSVQEEDATQKASTLNSTGNVDNRTNIIGNEVSATMPVSHHGHGVSAMAPESSLVGLLVGTDKPIRKSNLREQQAVGMTGSFIPTPVASNTTTSTPVRLGNSERVAATVMLPASENDLAHYHHYTSLRGAALTTHDLKSSIQLESQSSTALPMRTSAGMKNRVNEYSRLLHSEQEREKQSGTLCLDDIATRPSAEFTPTGTQQTIGAQQQDKQQVVFLQREIEQLVRMNDHLNAALERSELMRHEDAVEYEHRIGILQSASEKQTLLFSTQQQDLAHSEHLLDDKSVPQVLSVDVICHTLAKSLGTKRAMKWQENPEMEELISMLSVQLHQQKEETAALQQEKAALQQEIEELSAEILSLEDEKEQIVTKNEQINRDKVALEHSLAHISARVATTQHHEKELLQQSVGNELHLLRGQLDLSQSAEEHSKTTILRLERLVQEQQQLIKELSTRLHHNEEINQQAQQQVQIQLLSSQEEVVKLTLTREQLERENQRLQNQLDLQKKEVAFKLQDTEKQMHTKGTLLHENQFQIEMLHQSLNKEREEHAILSKRIQLFKDQESKLSKDIEMLNRRLQLEQHSSSTNLASYRQSMDESKQSYDDLYNRYLQLEEDHRRVVRETHQQVTELEESVSVHRKTNQDLLTRNVSLTEQNDEFSGQLQQDKVEKKKYKEQIHQLERQANQERKSMQQKIQDLQCKVDQQTQWIQQHESQLKQSDETRKHLQDTMSLALQTQTERFQSLQLLHEQSTRELEISKEERRKEQRAYEDSIRGMQRAIDSFKSSQVQLERQLASVESENVQLQQSCLLKSQDQEMELKSTSDQVQGLLREIHDLTIRLQQEERQNTSHRQCLDTIRNKVTAFAQIHQLSFTSNSQPDIIVCVQEIFSWFSRTFHELQDEVQLLEKKHEGQEEFWKRRLATLEETVLHTSASCKESQQKLEQMDKKHLEQTSEMQTMQLNLQKKDFMIQELNLQIDASRRECQHMFDQHCQIEKQLIEEKQKLKSLDSSLKLSKEKEVLVQDGIQQLRHQLSQVESEKSMVEEQYQALQRLHMQLEAQERENEAKSLQQLKEVGQERLRTMDAIRQAEQLQRKKDILEEELAERNQYWENRWSSYSSKVADDERKWKDTQGSLGRELRQAKDDLSVSDEKLRQHDRELQKAINDVRMLRQELEGMTSKALLERVQKELSSVEMEYVEEKAKWRDSAQQSRDTQERLQKELLQHQRLVIQLHEAASVSMQSSTSSPRRDSPPCNQRSRSTAQLVSNEPLDLKHVSTTLVEHLQDLAQQEKLLNVFSDVWLESLAVSDTAALENDSSSDVSFRYLQRMRTFLQHLHPLPVSLLSSRTGGRIKDIQERCIVHLLQPLLREYEQVRQLYLETYHLSSTLSQNLDIANAQTQQLEEQLLLLRKQHVQEVDLYRENISQLEQEKQQVLLEQERRQALLLEELAQLNQSWELKWQQQEQKTLRHQESAARQVHEAAQSELLALQRQHDTALATIVNDVHDLQKQISIKDNLNRALEESLVEKMKALGKRSEDIEQWKVRFQQQLVYSESTQAELNNIKRTLSAKEDLLLEMAATNRRLEMDVASMQEKLCTRSEQVRLLVEQVQVLELEVAEESVAKERLEQRLERHVFKESSSSRRRFVESHSATVGHTTNAVKAKASTLSTSTSNAGAGTGPDSAIHT
jgi:hypothetical protein